MRAKWIWAHQKSYVYNETVIARRSFTLREIQSATANITADSLYRLFINDQWVNDGPCRSWPEHFQYDQIDVTPYLCPGQNDIRIIARHYGIGDFHGVYQRPGLWMQLDLTLKDGSKKSIITDKNWDIAVDNSRISSVPKISIQMEPVEMVDARLADRLRFHKAAEICGAADGPWKDLNARDVALMTRKPFALKRFVRANTIQKSTDRVFCVPAARLCNPGIIVPANAAIGAACGMATEITLKKKAVIKIQNAGWDIAIDGKSGKNNQFTLAAGKHFILALSPTIAAMHLQDKLLAIQSDANYILSNPLSTRHENPWAWLRFSDYHFLENDMHSTFALRPNPKTKDQEDRYAAYKRTLFRQVHDKASFKTHLASKARLLASANMYVEDTIWAFEHRQVASAVPKVLNGPAAISDNPNGTEVYPSRNGDVELIYDLGEQNLGYWHFDLEAPEGVIVDMNAVEHLNEGCRPQRTLLNRNGFRYVTRKGRNQFTSMKMRSGRYLFVTFRHLTAPVRLRHIGIIETTYPVDYKASFACSDPQMERIWEISERTEKLCMLDSYVDCPLYEQTLWVGDARNESLFGYVLFGAEDIALRCIRLAAESMERYPMAGCQVPSSWDCLLPAWSFLWGMSVWDYYWHTGDKAFLRQYWPKVKKNLKGAAGFLNEQGLYSAPHWNLFDWSGIDQNKDTVFHNSMLMVGAIEAAMRCAKALNKREEVNALRQQAVRLKKTINRYWDYQKKSYPDSIHYDGSISPSTSQHTSFLSLLYDIAPPSIARDCIRNTTNPPSGMVRIGAPFAIFYLYECWEKLGLYDEIFRSIRDNYLPMLEEGATTVWECFPGNSYSEELTDGGPTRSHCHAWSSAPVYFIARVILGVVPTQPGGKVCQISPWVKDLQWAKGTVNTFSGPVQVSWRRKDKTLYVEYSGPKGVKLKFVPNTSHHGLNCVVNGKPR